MAYILHKCLIDATRNQVKTCNKSTLFSTFSLLFFWVVRMYREELIFDYHLAVDTRSIKAKGENIRNQWVLLASVYLIIIASTDPSAKRQSMSQFQVLVVSTLNIVLYMKKIETCEPPQQYRKDIFVLKHTLSGCPA
mmetsp:Transcript_5291/g.12867  ORF Transcript_5291/g.12867 Transcript_5291/m.12867 type:complete len:137 (+) Transcript_5291:1940-2350(+)